MTLPSFFKKSDPKLDQVVLPLPSFWWSRPYEYAWASQYAKGCVLDAACGISHPFKFWLTEHCSEVHGCDLDPKILSHSAILKDIAADFGEQGAARIKQEGFLNRLKLLRADLSMLPYGDKTFDTIFCISVFEHLPDSLKPVVMKEFHRTLKSGGTLVMTLDYPLASPPFMLQVIEDSGFEMTAPHDFSIPDDAISGHGLMCYRLLLNKKRSI
ncbi:class I SAM-dependent methyltransferase [Paenibacillus sp. 1001270B_150601_E10]|uniref:class I SAM-dependent methyltransferase n=1 Tax=Paenibacillus sp. 1001270B_150601_E10 TaxID=2787079 RepID=UPI00189C7B64|nr:class I SAM-dependent methyltransferase [Paenibacillus sp. 1001270B_150601_E10]